MDVADILGSVISFIENYGWYLLITIVIGIYIYNQFLKERIQEYLRWKSEQEYSAKYHKNPDLLEKRLNAQQTYASKLQEKYNREAEEYKRKMEEKEARKKEELLNKLEGKGGTKLGSSSKSDYNPLMGAGTSGGYRPPKKSCCKKGGGCG
ncbi:uncharacterized protein LOC123306683 [Coccinella septempunctata]|uniref:uncharacterized protein LOC123306683 n=1 Tax=Coccinella septempunctata TaxID=41139 RepID=UPI001D066772|nr:uncharacterized protein LOC123306683 [Coccinella septempunctata]